MSDADSAKSRLTHVDQSGQASMVDVSNKDITTRTATARGHILMQPKTVEAIQSNALKKGDVLAAARIAGIMVAKRTHELIPLCHPLALNKVAVDIEPLTGKSGFAVETLVRTQGKTGVEMEALTACSVALLTLYDMAKAIDRHMVVQQVEVTSKSGGASGDWKLDPS